MFVWKKDHDTEVKNLKSKIHFWQEQTQEKCSKIILLNKQIDDLRKEINKLKYHIPETEYYFDVQPVDNGFKYWICGKNHAAVASSEVFSKKSNCMKGIRTLLKRLGSNAAPVIVDIGGIFLSDK